MGRSDSEVLLDSTTSERERVAAARRLEEEGSDQGMEALVTVACDPSVGRSLAWAAGEGVARILLRRDKVEDAPLADFSGGAYEAFDQVIGLSEGRPLGIGSVVGGMTDSARIWSEAITRLTIQVDEARRGWSSPLSVNAVFHVPGNILKPEFEGVRTGTYSKKDGWLMVQVALPEQPPDDVDSDLKERLMAAVEEAERWARRRQVADDLTELRQLVGTL
jgi:hypothetical protein